MGHQQNCRHRLCLWQAGEGYSTKRGNLAADSLQEQQRAFANETTKCGVDPTVVLLD
jgi:hypothetical protein